MKFIPVAHRGDATAHPENTIAAFASAARLGLHHVELDVQVSADDVPLVLHDVSLERTHGRDVHVTKHTLADLRALGVLAGGSKPPAVPRLSEFAEWLGGEPGMQAFVELKKESLHARGRRNVLARVLETLAGVRRQAIIISYDARVLAMAQRAAWPIGFVLETMAPRYQRIADNLRPEYLFADFRHVLRRGALWPGDWQWAAFDLEDVESARRTSLLGVRYIESMNPALLLGAVES